MILRACTNSSRQTAFLHIHHPFHNHKLHTFRKIILRKYDKNPKLMGTLYYVSSSKNHNFHLIKPTHRKGARKTTSLKNQTPIFKIGPERSLLANCIGYCSCSSGSISCKCLQSDVFLVKGKNFPFVSSLVCQRQRIASRGLREKA